MLQQSTDLECEGDPSVKVTMVRLLLVPRRFKQPGWELQGWKGGRRPGRMDPRERYGAALKRSSVRPPAS